MEIKTKSLGPSGEHKKEVMAPSQPCKGVSEVTTDVHRQREMAAKGVTDEAAEEFQVMKGIQTDQQPRVRDGTAQLGRGRADCGPRRKPAGAKPLGSPQVVESASRSVDLAVLAPKLQTELVHAFQDCEVLEVEAWRDKEYLNVNLVTRFPKRARARGRLYEMAEKMVQRHGARLGLSGIEICVEEPF